MRGGSVQPRKQLLSAQTSQLQHPVRENIKCK